MAANQPKRRKISADAIYASTILRCPVPQCSKQPFTSKHGLFQQVNSHCQLFRNSADYVPEAFSATSSKSFVTTAIIMPLPRLVIKEVTRCRIQKSQTTIHNMASWLKVIKSSWIIFSLSFAPVEFDISNFFNRHYTLMTNL